MDSHWPREISMAFAPAVPPIDNVSIAAIANAFIAEHPDRRTIAPERKGVNPIAQTVVDRLDRGFPQPPARSVKSSRCG
jgi:hypothetical protein